ncbi:tetratricopeptide repeat-containing S1 family peptidase [Nostoc sp.]
MNQNLAIICSLLFLPFPVFANETSSPTLSQAASEISSCAIKADNVKDDYSENKLQTLASRITVRVIGDNNGGSGTLLAKRGNTYLVLSNSHVVRGVNSINLQTSDGKTYAAQIVPNTNFDKLDLALLQFQSNQNYCLPKEIAQLIPTAETPVMAAGYSSEKGQIVFRTGKVQQIAEKPLKEGYQIGYNSNIEQGMSGGAILNIHGELIGINGRGAYPILNTGYVYPDGSRPTESEIKRMRSLSWGIPISTVLVQVNTEILTAYSLPLPNIPDEDRPKVLTGWLGELEEKAKQITVRIDNIGGDNGSGITIKKGGNGSGIIIAKDGNTYTVLTASHVVCGGEDATKPCVTSNYQILAPDGKQYPVDKGTIKTEEGVDLAVVKFTASNQNYQVATLANYNPNDADYMFTAGYRKLGENSPWRFTVGRIFSKEEGLLAVKESDFQSNSFGRSQSVSSLTGGYELVYTSITYRGMSGGPVLDSQGRVIGIHGRAEGEQVLYEKIGDAKSRGSDIQLGYSLGIPISTFLGIATRLGIQAQKVENISARQLDVQQIKSIQEAVLSIDVSKGNTTARRWIERGNQLWRLGRYQEAVKAFDEAIKLKPAFVYLAYYGKDLALGWDRKYQESVDALESAVKLKPDFVAAWESLSVNYRQLNQLEQALLAINKAIQLQPENANLYNQKCEILEDLKRYTEAETAINKAIKLNLRAVFLINRGALYSDQKKWKLALDDYTKAIAINPQSAGAYTNRGNLYKDQKKGELAEADYNKAIAINPQYNYAYYNRGVLYSDQKKWKLALADYTKAIAINPQFARAYTNRGNLYSDQKKWELALADYTKAIAINPQLAEAFGNRGNVYSDQKKWELALSDYTKAIAINPQLAEAFGNRGNVYSDQRKWELALADYTKAIAINPQLAEAYYNRGVLYGNQKKWELALSDYTKVIAINPQLALAYSNRGNLYYDQKKWELALADYNKAIAINPQLALAYSNRGNLYYDQKKWELALADYTKAIAINPQYAKAYYNRGNVYYNQKKWELALADYTKVIAINPQYADAYYNRGILYLNKEDKQKAVPDLQQAVQLFQAQGNTDAYERVMNTLKNLQK